MERLIVVVGPTAVGKTKVSIDLARHLSTEIISGDSMLVYRGMNIGTAKPNVSEKQGVVHHLIDIRDPQQEFSVVEFQKQAGDLIHHINSKGRIPILAGGTGLYVRALLEDYQFHPATGSEELRKKFTDLAEVHGSHYLHNLLQTVCPERAAQLHPNDLRRIIRALEVFHLAGQSVTETAASLPGRLCYDALVIGLTMNRSKLYEQINKRVDHMLADGLIDEVKHLVSQGLSLNNQSMQGIGYKEVLLYLNGEIDSQTLAERIKQATRNFAKRQLTWYRKMPYIHWVDCDLFPDYEERMAYIYSLVAGKFPCQVE